MIMKFCLSLILINMETQNLLAISPVDGRYNKKVAELVEFFSEYALIRYRLMVEVEYFICLCKIPLPQLKSFDTKNFDKLKDIYLGFTVDEALKVKTIEQTTNHDVKAVEYYLKEKFNELDIRNYKEFIHFGLTSQDINNTAMPLMLKAAVAKIYLPLTGKITAKLKQLSEQWADVPMLARTHGQPASPTRLGKEIKVFLERLETQVTMLKQIPFSAKFGGATGNFNAHHVAYPATNWIQFSNTFVNDVLGLQRLQTTTQVEHYDNLAALFDAMKRINTVLIDLTRDFWTYISMEYFKQKISEKEVGSSAMPHKVNPIDFENSEGNFGIANAMFEHLSAKLPISRLQRDLTDSTVTRNIGVPVAHTILAMKSLLTGLDKILINEDAVKEDLNKNYAVVAEAIQTILRREGYPNPYEALKELTRKNQAITAEIIAAFILKLQITDALKQELLQITPWNYTGI